MPFMDWMLIDQPNPSKGRSTKGQAGLAAGSWWPKMSVRQFSSAGLGSKTALHGGTKAASP